MKKETEKKIDELMNELEKLEKISDKKIERGDDPDGMADALINCFEKLNNHQLKAGGFKSSAESTDTGQRPVTILF